MRAIGVLAILLILNGCVSAKQEARPTKLPNSADSIKSANDIRTLRDASNTAIARHDVEKVVSFLDDEYQITVGSGALFHGRADEREAWGKEFARADDLLYVRTPDSVEVSLSNNRAAEIGTWVGSWTTPAGVRRSGGRYAAYWRRAEASWKIRSELFVTLWCEGPDCL